MFFTGGIFNIGLTRFLRHIANSDIYKRFTWRSRETKDIPLTDTDRGGQESDTKAALKIWNIGFFYIIFYKLLFWYFTLF